MQVTIISVLQLTCRLISRPLRMVVEQQQDPFQKRHSHFCFQQYTLYPAAECHGNPARTLAFRMGTRDQ